MHKSFPAGLIKVISSEIPGSNNFGGMKKKDLSSKNLRTRSPFRHHAIVLPYQLFDLRTKLETIYNNYLF